MKKILYYIFLSILIISCTSFNEENDVHEKVDLKKLSNELFSTGFVAQTYL